MNYPRISTTEGNQSQILFIHIYLLYMLWFGWVLWHINHCRLFNAKSFYTCIKYMISKHILWITFLNEPELIFYTHLVLLNFDQFSLALVQFFYYIKLSVKQFYSKQFNWAQLQFKCQHFYFKPFSLAWVQFFVYTLLIVKTCPSKTSQFTISKPFKCQTVLFDP